MTKHNEPAYDNNPFTIAVEGAKLFYAKGRTLATLAIVFGFIGFASNFNPIGYLIPGSDEPSKTDTMTPPPIDPQTIMIIIVVIGVVIATVLFVAILVNAFIYGMLGSISAKLARGEEATFEQTLSEAFKGFMGMLWLTILMSIKVLLWSLLFIIPGIYMSVRYSLATVVFFTEGKRGNAAIKRSLKLTKGAWLTTFASHTLLNLLTLGMFQLFLTPGTDGLLYRQLNDQTEAKVSKPKAHVLSWITLGFLIFLVIAAIIILALLVYALKNFANS